MNMFRNLLSTFLLVFGLGLVFGSPQNWSWFESMGPVATDFLHICITFRPFVVAACIVLALALFMTKKQY